MFLQCSIQGETQDTKQRTDMLNQQPSLYVFNCMIRFITTCLLIALLQACAKKQTPVNYTPINPTSSSSKTFLALGDSYTIGQGVTAAERFPHQTVAWLKLNGVDVATPTYIATTGWTTGSLQYAIETNKPATHDVVTVLIGVNDQYQTHDTTNYRLRFTQLLEKAIQLAKGKKQNVFVLSIPDYSVTPFASGSDTARIRLEIDWFNAINKNVTASYLVAYLDITPSYREGRYDRTLIAADGLHPSGLEYKKWAERLGALMLGVLK